MIMTNEWQDLLNPETGSPREQLQDGEEREFDIDSNQQFRDYVEGMDWQVVPGARRTTHMDDKSYEKDIVYAIGGHPHSGDEVYARVKETGEYNFAEPGEGSDVPEEFGQVRFYEPEEATLVVSKEELNIDSLADRSV